MNWLKRIPYPVVCLILMMLYIPWCFLIRAIYIHYGIECSQYVEVYASGKIIQTDHAILLELLFPLMEEMIGRWLPMLLLFAVLNPIMRKSDLHKDKYLKTERYALLVLVVLTSAVFGLLHGNVYNLLLQGVLGLNLIIIYLRALFIQRDRGLRSGLQLLPLGEAALFHILQNMSWYLFE